MDTPLPKKKIMVLAIEVDLDCVRVGNSREGGGVIFFQQAVFGHKRVHFAHQRKIHTRPRGFL